MTPRIEPFEGRRHLEACADLYVSAFGSSVPWEEE